MTSTSTLQEAGPEASLPFDRLPNLRNTLERTVPSLAAILWSLNVALFCSVSISTNDLLVSRFSFFPVPFLHAFSIPLVRHQLIIGTLAFISGCFLYMVLFYCVKVQLFNYGEDCIAPGAVKERWRIYTEDQSGRALWCLNMALFIMPYSLLMFLPDQLASVTLYLVTVLLLLFWKRMKKEPLVPGG